MRETKPDAPAYPVTAGNQVYATGMTLRDWFAGQASVGLLSRGMRINEADALLFGKVCYSIADAMLKAREARDA